MPNPGEHRPERRIRSFVAAVLLVAASLAIPAFPVAGHDPLATSPSRERGLPVEVETHPANPRPSTIINPERYYSAEPAPMGIADFGVTGVGASATGYSYVSSEFQGQAHIQAMSLTVTGSSSKVAAFELNAVLVLQWGGVNYSYWIQNGLHLDAASHQYTIGGAYVWNFSAPGARLTTGELQGASGSALASDTYYYIPACGGTYPGQCSTVSLPANLTGKIVAGEASGTPYVDYEYNLGSGWVTYDNVSFPHLTGARDVGFVVDGFSPTPYSAGLYYDSEWVWVGAGGGSTGVDQTSAIDLTLSYWNGHNFQAVPSAWDFGSNTGERNSNVTESFVPSATGYPQASLTAGAGSLGLLYNGTNVGSANVTGVTNRSETILVDGTPTSFSGRWANLTLTTGIHSISLENYSNSTQRFTIAPGHTTWVNFSGAGELLFIESGLPTHTPWKIQVNGTELSSTTRTIRFTLPNGSYPLVYGLVPGFHLPANEPGSVSLPGTMEVTLNFTQTVYNVAVEETGLPDSTPWWARVNGTEFQSTGVTILLSLPNGSTPFEAGASYTFIATPSNGTIVVTGGSAPPLSLLFEYRPCFVRGTVTPGNATVTVNGSAAPVSGGTFLDQLPPGEYLLEVGAAGYANQSRIVVLTPGNTSWANFTLVAPPMNVTGGGSGTTGAWGGLTTLLIILVAAVAASAAIAFGLLARRARRSRR